MGVTVIPRRRSALRRLCMTGLPLALAVNGALANAGNYSCTGAVTYLGLDAGGDLTVALASTPIHKICNVGNNDSTFMANAATCRVMYASLLASRVSGKPAIIYYSPNGYSCGNLPSWGRIPGVYFVNAPAE